MEVKKRDYVSRLIIAVMITVLLSPLAPPVLSQPQGYTLVYQAPRAYGVDWMDVKAVYVKTEENRLYFYVEYYGAMPNSGDYYQRIYIYMDTDRNIQTGSVSNELGGDYYIYFYLCGDNSSSYARLYKWNITSKSWKSIKDLRSNARLAPELSYMEIWVDQQDIGYTSVGIDFYITAYSLVNAMPKTELNYVIGSSVKSIVVDGEPGDWGDIAPLVSFPSRSINPPELEFSGIYFANDAENLYVRMDARGTPTANINTGTLYRFFYIYLDTDNNNGTGYGPYSGADFYASSSFHAQPSKYSYIDYYRYAGTGGDNWNWQWVSGDSESSNFNSVFEFKIPLSRLGAGPGQSVGIYIGSVWWYLYRPIPRPVYSASYPPATTGGGGATGFFGSETVLLAVVAAAMVAEAALIILLMRRVKKPPPPPPPPA
ncbi:MAG: hypothetical protein ACP5PQ_06465 [Thermoproteota archaeon]